MTPEDKIAQVEVQLSKCEQSIRELSVRIKSATDEMHPIQAHYYESLIQQLDVLANEIGKVHAGCRGVSKTHHNQLHLLYYIRL